MRSLLEGAIEKAHWFFHGNIHHCRATYGSIQVIPMRLAPQSFAPRFSGKIIVHQANYGFRTQRGTYLQHLYGPHKEMTLSRLKKELVGLFESLGIQPVTAHYRKDYLAQDIFKSNHQDGYRDCFVFMTGPDAFKSPNTQVNHLTAFSMAIPYGLQLIGPNKVPLPKKSVKKYSLIPNIGQKKETKQPANPYEAIRTMVQPMIDECRFPHKQG
jgi:hypothetical protein